MVEMTPVGPRDNIKELLEVGQEVGEEGRRVVKGLAKRVGGAWGWVSRGGWRGGRQRICEEENYYTDGE